MPETKDKKDQMERAVPMPDSKPKPRPKKVAPPAPLQYGLDWEKIRTDFEKVYLPERGEQLAGRQIARIVVTALRQLKKNN